jgi:hypothetical protein
MPSARSASRKATMTVPLLIIRLSLALQLMSAFIALRLILFSERRAAGILMLMVVFLMAFRRTIPLYRLIDGDVVKIDVFGEVVACMISFLLLLAIVYVNRLIISLQTLNGLLPICASCKKIRDDKGYWTQIELYIRDHSQAEFSHGICPDRAERLYPSVRYGKQDDIGGR